jgi:hypothetical protein
LRVGCYQLQSQPAGPADRSVFIGLIATVASLFSNWQLA